MNAILLADDDVRVLDVPGEMLRLGTISGSRTTPSDPSITAISGGGRIGSDDCLQAAKHPGADATLAEPLARKAIVGEPDSQLMS